MIYFIRSQVYLQEFCPDTDMIVRRLCFASREQTNANRSYNMKSSALMTENMGYQALSVGMATKLCTLRFQILLCPFSSCFSYDCILIFFNQRSLDTRVIERQIPDIMYMYSYMCHTFVFCRKFLENP